MKRTIRKLCRKQFVFLWLTTAASVSGLAVPLSERVNRRKSPALWREDLCIHHDNMPIERGLLQKPPEIMSPVGGWPQLRAAIGNGADSIYLGLSAFSARARATNFDPITELPKAVAVSHRAGVKVYVALNTLVFDHELNEVEELIRICAKANVDALIVQDLGVAKMASYVAPSLEIHASTQQTVTSADGAAFCNELFQTSRIVLGRELSIAEIDNVSSHLNPDIEIEAFVHGALCVSYSGQCFSSEAWGGRSANRGQCAQACRLPYGLIDNGTLQELGDFSYLLSPQDLCGVEQVPRLLDAQVSCLKIEGRLKDAAYVAATTRAYRNAVDRAWEEYCQNHGVMTTPTRRLQPETVSRKELAQLFSRGQDEHNNGLSPGFFEGSRHQHLVRGRSPRHRGVHVGRVDEGSNWKRGLIVKILEQIGELKLGDGIVVDRGMAQEEELGGAIFEIQNDSKGRAIIQFSKEVERRWKKYDDRTRKGLGSGVMLAPTGAHVWKTSDATVDKKMKRLSELSPPRKTVRVSVSGSLGQCLEVCVDDGRGRKGIGRTQGELTPAEKAGLSTKTIQKAIGTLGNTQWAIDGDVDDSELEYGAWCPVSWIKEARRQAIDDLLSQDSECENFINEKKVHYDVTEMLLDRIRQAKDEHHESKCARLSVLARTNEQVEVLCNMIENGVGIAEIIIDFLEVDGMREAVERTRQAGVRTIVASPRIIKPDESGIWRTLLRLETDGLLVRSTGLLYRMMKLGGSGARVSLGDVEGDTGHVTIPELIGDFSLNVANALTAWELLQYGCSRVTASYDLSANAITELLETLGEANAPNVEIVTHAHLPIFHTEHCAFARFLSNGNSFVDCGHACTRHNVHLRDQTGADNLVLADMGCRNTIFSAQAQSGVHSLQEWSKAGANRFRIELIDESPEDVKRIVNGYRSVLDGTSRPNELWESLENVCDSNGRKGGVSYGSLRNIAERRAGAIL